jgi:hypothetical protein
VTSGGVTGSGGTLGSGGTPDGGTGGGAGEEYVVAMLPSSKAQATELTESDVAELVASAVSPTGGLDFIEDGQIVVLKPNLVTFYQDADETLGSQTVRGVNTDWRVTKAVADLVRAQNPTGTILVMEGSTLLTSRVFSLLGYTSDNFGSSVDEVIDIPTLATDAWAGLGGTVESLGTTDTANITVVGKQVSEIATPFAGKQTDVCPGI